MYIMATNLLTYSMDGQLEFYDTESSDFTLMASSEHSMATDLEWDPTGRHVVTSVSYWSQKVLNYVVTLCIATYIVDSVCVCVCVSVCLSVCPTACM